MEYAWEYAGRYTAYMMELSILQILAAGLVPFIVGSLWYHPRIFGTRWMSLKKVTPEMAERSSRLALHSTAVMLFLGIVSSFVFWQVFTALEVDSFSGALFTAISIWLGFMVPATLNRILWDHMGVSLYLIETGQWFVSLVIMSLIFLY